MRSLTAQHLTDELGCSQMNCRIIYFISKCHFPSTNLWPQHWMDRYILLLGNLVSFCGEAADVFCVSMVNLPRCTQDNNEGSQRPAEWRRHVWAIVALGGVTQHDVCPDNPSLLPPAPPPSSWEFWDRQRLGLLAKGMTHGMTKLLCLSVRLGLYPTDIFWLRLIQAPEKPRIRVRNICLFFHFLSLYFCLVQKNERGKKKLISNPYPVFFLFFSWFWNIIASAKKKKSLLLHCSGVFSTSVPASPRSPNLIGD